MIALRLGWSLVEDGAFKWIDPLGDTMVESIWWIDGLLDLHMPGAGREVVGEGWVVIASQSAIRAIQQEFGSLSKKSLVARHYIRDGVFEERSASSLSHCNGIEE